MRHVLAALPLFATLIIGSPNLITEFLEPQLPVQNDTIVEESLELVKRQSGCADGYNGCGNIGAPGLCCRNSQVCSKDAVGQVACCPINAACTGAIGGIATNTLAPTTTSPLIFPTTTTTNGGFVQQPTNAASYVRSTVPNSFYPFAFIPTTYTNAAACSSAYTSCQTDAASCTADLANGRQGVTISAPNGGVTITAIASLGLPSAVSICASLSSQACYGLQVEACNRYGPGTRSGAARNLCGDVYKIGAGIAVGMAGQIIR